MSTRDRTLGGRILALPGQFLLALINASAILVIVACVLVLMTLGRIETAGASLADAAAGAALARLDMTSETFQARLDRIEARLSAISTKLQDPEQQNAADLRRELSELTAMLQQVADTARALAVVQPEVTQAAIRQAGQTVTDSLLGLAGCEQASPAGAAPGS
ncbi:hypothetical protein GCM10011316_09030 [Roseibium aquae]|uniref:Uncharacterized protein n=1 Tax=Roseibium aquae TaxID=1323746 RepID=A0A916TCT8_9HYPH|nr:hypothetical protein [Roseibium aquae]GGB39189.1 hypothetical protein GCM10011316_09030 [Roseibium aquae]